MNELNESNDSIQSAVERPSKLLTPGMCLTLRPMAYPQFYDAYLKAIKGTWSIEEISFSTDVMDLRNKIKYISTSEGFQISALNAPPE